MCDPDAWIEDDYQEYWEDRILEQQEMEDFEQADEYFGG